MYDGKIHYSNSKGIFELKQGKGLIKEYNDYCSHIIYEWEYFNG